jgi:hypothetical protein
MSAGFLLLHIHACMQVYIHTYIFCREEYAPAIIADALVAFGGMSGISYSQLLNNLARSTGNAHRQHKCKYVHARMCMRVQVMHRYACQQLVCLLWTSWSINDTCMSVLVWVDICTNTADLPPMNNLLKCIYRLVCVCIIICTHK